MTSKLVVNTIEADTGISSVSFASSISLSSTSVFHLGDAGLNIGADTNISRAGNGILAFNINGGEKVRIDTNGNLDIATGQLIISNDIKSSDDDFYLYSYKGGSDGQVRSGIQFDSNSQRLRFFTATNERLRIDTNGRLLLNTTTEGHAAADELTISNTVSGADMGITLRSAANGQGAIYFSDGTSGDAEYRGIINYNHTSDFLNFYTAAAERLRILSNGHVAIGNDIANDTGMFKVDAADGQSDDQYVGQFINREATASRNYGVNIQAGSNSTDHGFRVRNGANNATHFEVRGDGVVSKPAHPSFSAKGVGSTFTYFANNNAWYSLGDTVLTNTSYKNDQNFATSHSFGMNRGVLSNGNSCFNADTTVFTAPVDGFYHFSISLYLRATQGGGTCHIGPWINYSNTNVYMYNGSDTTSGDLAYPPATRTIDVKLSAGDTFFWAVYAVGTDKFSIYQDYSYISGYLIG